MSFVERLNVLCSLLGISFKRVSTVINQCKIQCIIRIGNYSG